MSQQQNRDKDGKYAPDSRGKVPPVVDTVSAALPAEEAGGADVGEVFSSFKNLTNDYCDVSIPPLPTADEAKKVIIVRGLPGSGKSTWARSVMDAYPEGTVVRINNDDISQMVFGKPFTTGVDGVPALFAEIRSSMLKSLLRNPTVRIVILDNTNLVTKTVAGLVKTAGLEGADVDVDDRFLAVPLEECLRRNEARSRQVPDDAIRRMHKQASNLRSWSNDRVLRITPYPNDDETLPETVAVDLDGTLAIMGDRGPYEWHRVGEDVPNEPVVNMVRGLIAQGKHVTVVSARDGSCLRESTEWVEAHLGKGVDVVLKEANDNRPAYIVKPELFHTHLAGRKRVSMVIDDEPDVVTVLQRMGLPCMQVSRANKRVEEAVPDNRSRRS